MALVVVDDTEVTTEEEGSQRHSSAKAMQANRILAVDGREPSRCDQTMIYLSPGCHLITAVYQLTWQESAARGTFHTSSGTLETPAARGNVPDFGTTKVLFAVPMAANRTYKINVRQAGRPHTRIQEIEASGVTLREYHPVDFATRSCDQGRQGVPPTATASAKTGADQQAAPPRATHSAPRRQLAAPPPSPSR
jgi:hypothetical protein